MTKYLLAAIAALILALSGAGFLLKREIAAHAVEKAARVAVQSSLDGALERESDLRKASVARAAAIASERRKSAAAQAALRKALDVNRAWADQPVPKEVQDALGS